MSYSVFDFDMVDKDTLVVNDGDRLVRLLTGNDMDSAYCIVPAGVDGEELEGELKLSFRRKYGNLPFKGYEDVSYLLEEL